MTFPQEGLRGADLLAGGGIVVRKGRLRPLAPAGEAAQTLEVMALPPVSALRGRGFAAVTCGGGVTPGADRSRGRRTRGPTRQGLPCGSRFKVTGGEQGAGCRWPGRWRGARGLCLCLLGPRRQKHHF